MFAFESSRRRTEHYAKRTICSHRRFVKLQAVQYVVCSNPMRTAQQLNEFERSYKQLEDKHHRLQSEQSRTATESRSSYHVVVTRHIADLRLSYTIPLPVADTEKLKKEIQEIRKQHKTEQERELRAIEELALTPRRSENELNDVRLLSYHDCGMHALSLSFVF